MFNRLLLSISACLVAAVSHAQVSAPLEPSKVLASNQWVSVTYEDFVAEMARIPVQDQFEFLLDRQRIAQLVDNILVNKTLAREAVQLKVDQDRAVQAEVRNQVEKVLAKHRGQHLKDNLPKVDYLARAREIYLANPERFTRPAQYLVWHTLVGLTGRTRDQARLKADQLHDRLKKGEPEERLAETESDDGSAKKNKGVLGFSDLKNYDPRFAAAVRALKAGELSAPVESEYGFHLIKVREVRPTHRFTFDELKADLLIEAEIQYRNTALDQHLRTIKADPKLFVDTAALEAIRPKLPEIPAPSPAKPPSK
ncbi:MAG: peptidylprolyl isomerase [Betaproteobacteria bacterium]|nr:peptidylprolyl isomerase [Betaproteobacteria bacterium]